MGNVILVGAEAAFWMGMTDLDEDDEVRAALENIGVLPEVPLSGVRETVTALFPINDNSNPDVPGAGTHWSLLSMEYLTADADADSPSLIRWRHYDSSSGSSNLPAA